MQHKYTQDEVKKIFGPYWGNGYDYIDVKHEPIRGFVPLNGDKPIPGVLYGRLYVTGEISWYEFVPDDGTEPFDPGDVVEKIPANEIEIVL